MTLTDFVLAVPPVVRLALCIGLYVGVSVGMAYDVEWKITKDQLGEFVLPGGKPIDVELPDKHKVWAVGPDVTLPVASKSKLFALVNVRYLWETGARVKTQGGTLVVTATVPIPSMNVN